MNMMIKIMVNKKMMMMMKKNKIKRIKMVLIRLQTLDMDFQQVMLYIMLLEFHLLMLLK